MNSTADNNPQHQHGHVVMTMIAQADPPHTRQTLGRAVAEAFGPDVRFYTCSAEGLDLDGLLAFLAERGKVTEANGRLATDIGQMCDHE